MPEQNESVPVQRTDTYHVSHDDAEDVIEPYTPDDKVGSVHPPEMYPTLASVFKLLKYTDNSPLPVAVGDAQLLTAKLCLGQM